MGIECSIICHGSNNLLVTILFVCLLSPGAFGDYTKEYIKAETPTNEEEEVRKYYQEVKK